MTSNPIQVLQDLGFTALEAEVYIFLLKESPATGYRIAQGIGKPAANTYKAIETLQTKGAIIVDEGESRRCQAVPADELMSQLERNFHKRRSDAAQALARLGGVSDGLGVYQLRSREQVLERSRSMLLRCQQVAICTLFPEPLEELQSDIQSAAARGVMVAVTTYRPVEMPSVEVIVEPRSQEILQRWPGQWLNLVIDGTELLLALLGSSGAGVHQAVWTANSYLSWVYHSAVSATLYAHVLSRQIKEGASIEQLRKTLRYSRRFYANEAIGYQNLIEQFFGHSPKTDSKKRHKKKTSASASKSSVRAKGKTIR
jgi:sugar-specific transcriptional regulator TrmB